MNYPGTTDRGFTVYDNVMHHPTGALGDKRAGSNCTVTTPILDLAYAAHHKHGQAFLRENKLLELTIIVEIQMFPLC
jgi:hypothetical protein